ncbi:glycosyltransferase [Hymenobacter sp. CRA2]|uniref:glycosyltransferase n=1 Tax=Hymenobacter sp. CRA2 TaxID=1955620 RepID=UPI00098F99EF|nr:glycosyltransferase [Hymenobacter sp. CRA2]OON67327.1 hypothetical protein B0919_17795 [Hymenobacter sp. CRA2]
MSEYRISYVVTTYNKLPYLQQVLGRLVAARQADEEIVVCDGGSKDGTAAYLQQLHDAGQIQQFVSEPDKGEAHGFNKGMLMARGELIKIITDDDAFHYPSIRRAAAFMQQHPEVDVLSGNTGQVMLEDPSYATLYEDVEANFQRWFDTKEVIWMIGLPLLIRRKSLALTGLFHTGMVQIDTEFTYRITSLKVNIAWSTAMLAMRIENPQSNFRVMNQGKAARASEVEAERMRHFYDKQIGTSYLERMKPQFGWSEILKRPLRPAKRRLFDVLNIKQYQGFERMPTGYVPNANADRLNEAFRVCDEFMEQFNARRPEEYKFRSQAIDKALQQLK